MDGSGQDFLVAKSNGSCLVNDGNGLIRFKKVCSVFQRISLPISILYFLVVFAGN